MDTIKYYEIKVIKNYLLKTKCYKLRTKINKIRKNCPLKLNKQDTQLLFTYNFKKCIQRLNILININFES